MKYTEIVINLLTKLDMLKHDDYKIIKCFEAQLMGEAIPYDYVSLINQRKQIRLDIADLEARKLALEKTSKEQE
jgi:hypothetical protein